MAEVLLSLSTDFFHFTRFVYSTRRGMDENRILCPTAALCRAVLWKTSVKAAKQLQNAAECNV